MNEKLNYKNINSIDSLRGIASLMVAFFHFSAGNQIYLSETNIVREIGRFGWVGVEIFFIISGFVIPYAMMRSSYKVNDFFRFLAKRILRIDPPYILSMIMVLVLAYLSTLYPYYRGQAFELDFTQIVLHFAYLNTFFDSNWLNPVYWSLAIEFQYYLLIAISFPLIVHKRLVVRYLSLIIFISLSFVFPETKYIFHYSLLFVFGFTLFLFQVKKIGRNEFLINSILILLGIYFYLDTIIFVASFFSFLFIIFAQNYESKVLKFLGKISYSLYLVHIPIGGRIINLAEQFIVNEIYRTLIIIIALAVSIFAAWVFYVVIENWSKKLSKKIGYKRKKRL